ncbi:hypothetical protein SNEBB_007231 [Seison nebaliae]|nr:hypothetical protein SNEBB_007231 [Seison nebaliae]
MKLFYNSLIRHVVRLKVTNTQRKKLPHQAKESEKWISAKNNENSRTFPKHFVGGSAVAEKTEEFRNRRPVDEVWCAVDYPPQPLEIKTAINYLRDLAHPQFFNYPSAFLQMNCQLNFKTKKKTSNLNSVNGLVLLPNKPQNNSYFEQKNNIIAIVQAEHDIKEAYDNGAFIAGYNEIIEKFKKNELSTNEYDYIIATPETFQSLSKIRKHVDGTKYPNAKKGTLTVDVGTQVNFHTHATSYRSVKLNDVEGQLEMIVGDLTQTNDELTENIEHLSKLLLEQKSDLDSQLEGVLLSNVTINLLPTVECKYRLSIDHLIPPGKLRNTNEEEDV